MKTKLHFTITALALSVSLVSAKEIRGTVTQDGKGVGGVFVSAHDTENRKATGVFTASDGTYTIGDLREKDYRVRARLKGLNDVWLDDVTAGSNGILIKMTSATGWKLERQRTADSAFGMLKFDSQRDKLNFKMYCSYCHQVGTVGFRTPEEPVDWETMIRRMDGFGALYPHTKRTIVKRIMDTYKGDAVDKWDLSPDGRLIYALNITKGYMVTVDTKTDEQVYKKFPRGSYGPHSIEPDNDGHMWVTMCASGQMAKYDIHKKEFEVYSSAEAPAKRGGYPHTLRVNPQDPEGFIWYTDAGRNSVFSLHPKTKHVKEYHLLSAHQAVAAGKGESRGITPYGIDYSPVDGMIWYSKLNGNRIGRINPSKPDGDIKEWNPPFRGPRRLHVAPDGIIWVPGFASGVFAKFHPVTEKWTVYDLPNKDNQIPYALNVALDGMVWICGTGDDTIHRFNPKTEMLVTYPLPNRVSYTREIEFDLDGNVWTPTSGPSRHMETGYGAIIKIEPNDLSDAGGIKLKGYMPDRSKLTYEQPRPVNYTGPNAKLLQKIAQTKLPEAYLNGKHQPYVDATYKKLTEKQKHRIHILWQEKRKADPEMPNGGQHFVRIMEYVRHNEK